MFCAGMGVCCPDGDGRDAMTDRHAGRSLADACTEVRVLGLDASTLQRIIAAGTLEVGLPDAAEHGQARAAEVAEGRPAIDDLLVENQVRAEVIGRLSSELDRVRASNRQLQGELDQAREWTREAVLVAALLFMLMLVGLVTALMAGGLLGGLDRMLQ